MSAAVASERLRESPETLVAWVRAPVLLPNFGGPGPWTSKRLRSGRCHKGSFTG